MYRLAAIWYLQDFYLFLKFISFPCSIYVIATVSMFVEQWEQVGGEFTITAFVKTDPWSSTHIFLPGDSSSDGIILKFNVR